MPPAQLSWDDRHGNSQATAAGDFDTDGWPDAVFARANGVSIVLNGGTGSLLGPVPTYATFASPSAVVVGDFDGDGDQDLVCNGWGRYLVLLWNGGDGSSARLAWRALGRGLAGRKRFGVGFLGAAAPRSGPRSRLVLRYAR